MMNTTFNVGRIVGGLLLAQIVGGVLVNIVLMAPVFAEPGFLENAAEHPVRVGLSVLIGLITGALAVAIAISLFPVIRRYSQAMALWFVALSVVGFSVTAVEAISVMSLLSLSEAYHTASAAENDLFQGLRVVVASARNWAHYVSLIIGGGTVLVLYSTLFRFALVPRILAVCGLAAAMLQIVAVSMPLFGQEIVFLMLLPLGLTHLVLAVWLIAKGMRNAG
jgi:hypothetical protein